MVFWKNTFQSGRRSDFFSAGLHPKAFFFCLKEVRKKGSMREKCL